MRRTDLVIENFRLGVTEKLRIDYARLRDINPKVIYLFIERVRFSGPAPAPAK